MKLYYSHPINPKVTYLTDSAIVKLVMNANRRILEIIRTELGERSADLFDQFYFDFPLEDQLFGAEEVLTMTIGAEKTKQLLRKISRKND